MTNNNNVAKRLKFSDDSVEGELEELNKSLVLQMCSVTTNTTTVMGQLDRSLPHQPLLEVEGYGLVGLPVSKRVATELEEYMEQAPYGMGEDTVMDRSVRDTLQVGPERFTIGNKEFSESVLSDVVKCVKHKLDLKEEVWAEPYKLLLYKPGGHFKPHRDTEKVRGMFGTLIVQLPSVFSGGDLVVRHAGKEVVVKMSQTGSPSYCMIAAHYSDCEHEVTVVEAGYRLALVYSLCWKGAGQAPSAERMMEKATSVKPLLLRYSKHLEKTSSRVCWALEHMYSDNSLCSGGTSVLKGKDRAVVETVMAANQMLALKDQFEVFLAKASKVRKEYGQCTRGGGYGGYRRKRWGGWGEDDDDECDGDCFDVDDCLETEISLSEFLDLLHGKKLSMQIGDFQPEKEVVNLGEDEEEFWGEGQGECSGPSGNAGATRDFWYNKWLLVMWRKSDGFLIKSKQSITAGMQHILNTCKEGSVVKTKGLLEQLLSLNSKDNPIETLLTLALAIDDDDSLKLMNKFLKPSASLSESVVSMIQALVVKLTWPVLETTLMRFMNTMSSSEISSFALDLALVVDDKDVCKKMLGKCLEPKLRFAPAQVIKLLSLIKKFSWPSLMTSIFQIMDNTDTIRLGCFALDLSLSVHDESLCNLMIAHYLSPTMDEPMQAKLLNVISNYSWASLGPTVMKLMENSDVSHVSGFAELFCKVGGLDVSDCERVIVKVSDMVLSTEVLMKKNKYMRAIFVQSFSTNLIPVYKLIMMFPMHLVSLSKQMASLPCLANLDLCSVFVFEIQETINNPEGLTVIAALEETFLTIAGKENKLSLNLEAVNKMIKVMTKLNREDSLQAMTNLVLVQPDNQAMLTEMLKTVPAETRPLPAPLLTLIRARVAFLQPRVTRGPPQFSWRQRKAVIPGHQRIEQFFRGDQQSYTYRGFTGVTVARKWVQTHSQDNGVCATFTAGGQRAGSFVEIVKKKEGFERFEMAPYRLRLEEHSRLTPLLSTSGTDNVEQHALPRTINPESSIDLTVD